jgi:hypothetical protein
MLATHSVKQVEASIAIPDCQQEKGEMNAIEQRSIFQSVAEINMLEEEGDILYEPQNHAESKASPQASRWSGARLNEKRSSHKCQVIERHKILVGAKVLKSRYVYKIKRDSTGASNSRPGWSC